MSMNDPIGQQVPVEYEDERQPSRVQKTLTFLNENRPAVHRWGWKALLAFNLILASLVFWLAVVPSLL